VPRAQDISICLIGFEDHKARPDVSKGSGLWLRGTAGDAAPFLDAFKASPAGFHGFLIEQRIGNERADQH